MPVNRLSTVDDARPTSDRLLESLEHWRDANTVGAHAPFVWSLRAIDANRAHIEHAKGALMLRYGIDPYQAFAMMVRWSHSTRIPVHTIARTLVYQGGPRTVDRHRPLMRWLEEQLRHSDQDRTSIPTPRDRSRHRLSDSAPSRGVRERGSG